MKWTHFTYPLRRKVPQDEGLGMLTALVVILDRLRAAVSRTLSMDHMD